MNSASASCDHGANPEVFFLKDSMKFAMFGQMNDHNTSFFVPQLLYEQILHWLRENILSGQVGPGKRLNETELQKLFGTSRAPIREAFRRLEVEGLVEIRPRKGVFVRSITIENLQEAATVRVVLEKLAARLATQRITPQDLLQLSAILKEMTEALLRPDIEHYTAVHYKFHKFLVDRSGNEVLSRAYSIVTEPFVTQRVASAYLKKRSKFERASHEELYQALVRRDASKLEELIEAHVISILSFGGT